MKKKFSFLLIPFCCILQPVFSQTPDPPPLQVDRANNTYTPVIVQKGYLQVESGVTGESNTSFMSFATPSLLLKYGVNKKFELRLASALLWSEGANTNLGVPPLLVGIKSSLIDAKGAVPAVSFLGEMAIDEAASNSYKAKYLAPRFRFLFNHSIGRKFALGYNAGMEWNGFTPLPTALYTVCGNYNFTDKFCLFLEAWGKKPQTGTWAHYADLGCMILLNNHSMLDLSGGANVAGSTYAAAGDYFFATLGYSFRINTIKKVETIFIR